MLFDPPSAEPSAAPRPATRRRPLDNPRVVAMAVLVLLAVLAGVLWLPGRVGQLDQSLVSEVVVYALSAVDLAMLAALAFVLARNVLKLWVERRHGAPFARFRAKLVAAMLAMTIVPASLVLVIGSEFIRSSADRWFSVPIDDALGAGKTIAQQYYREQQESAGLRAQRLARALPASAVGSGDIAAVQNTLRSELPTMRDGLIELYRATPTALGERDAVFVLGMEAGVPPRDAVRASADRLASGVAASGRDDTATDAVASGGVLVRAASPVRDPAGVVVGIVVVSIHVSGELASELRRATSAYEKYTQLSVLKGPLQGVYLSVFLMVTLMILVSATWMGLYVAKRITRPVQMLAEGARAIGAGRLDMRLEPETSGELGSLVEAFNTMAAELGTSQERLEQSRRSLEQKNIEVDARRRYIETILERVATGVISLDAEGRISTINGAAERLLGLQPSAVGQSATAVFAREDLSILLPLVAATVRREPVVIEGITLARAGGEVNLAAAATVLTGTADQPEGAVLVLDDVTPLIRSQRVAAWRDVARRLAHEIKNPLTPIQLSAERLKRNFANAPPNARALVDECTGAIIAEVDALKGLVDEFAQFARLRGPRLAPANLNTLVADTLKLYAGVLQSASVAIEQALGAELPPVRVDVEQVRQVIINLVDNAMEALGGPSAPVRPNGQPPTIVISTFSDPRNRVVRLTVVDNGPGVPPADRDKLFMPYYSTKGRGSGLGLAIVRRIIVEHGGSIEVGDAAPTGTVFTIDFPTE